MTTILMAIAGAIGALLFMASRKPDTFSVTRKASMAATPEAVFAQVNDLVAWQAWSPWAKKDPNAKAIFGTVTAGEGATFRWEGNNKVGIGTMTIVESQPFETIRFRLDFEKPFKATNAAEFRFQSDGNGITVVVWTMTGHANLMSKVMDTLMNMDKMVGADFEQGLANLKAIVEAR